MVRDDYRRPIVVGGEFIEQYRSFTSIFCNGVVGCPGSPFRSDGFILAQSSPPTPGNTPCHGSNHFVAVRGILECPAAGLNPIRPKRNSDEPNLLKLADRIVCTQHGDYVPLSPLILTVGFLAEEPMEIGNGAAILRTFRIQILISGNDD